MKLDPRSLALARICLGLLVFFHSFTFIADWTEFYGPQGVAACLPLAHSSAVPAYAVHLAIFVLLPLGGLCLALGLYTRVACAACLAASLLLHAKTPYVLSHAEDILRVLLLWFIFLPVARRWSLDAWRRSTTAVSLPLTHQVAGWIYTLQVCVIYWMAAYAKINPAWFLNGNALAYALNLEHLTTPFGLHLLRYPALLRHLTFVTPFLEFLGPFLLLSRFRPALCRMLAVCIFLFFHLVAIQSLLAIGTFCWVSAIVWLPFIPAYVWDYTAWRHPFFALVFEADANPLPVRRNFWDRGATTLVVVLFLDVLAWNCAALFNARDQFARVEPVGPVLGLDQTWRMYSTPYATHGWLILPATLADGSPIDLYTGRPTTDAKPPNLEAYFGDALEKRFLSNLFTDQDRDLLAAYADSMTQRWNQHHAPGQAVRHLEIVFLRQDTQPDLTITAPVRETLLSTVNILPDPTAPATPAP